MRSALFNSGFFFSPGQTQWAPGRDSHDPNPPITLETQIVGALVGSIAFAFTASAALTGIAPLAGTAAMVFTCSGTLIDRKKSLLYRPRSAVLMPLLTY